MCDFKNHPLIEIYRRHGSFDIDHVVRWCPDCGAVVIDGEHDGRIAPGKIVPMKFPKISLRQKAS